MIKRLFVLAWAVLPAIAQESNQSAQALQQEPEPIVEFYSWSVGGENYSVNFSISFDRVLPVFVPWGTNATRTVELKDSLGNKAANAQAFVSLFKPHFDEDEKLKVSVNAYQWLPAKTSEWLDVKLTMPCYVYEKLASKVVEFDVKKNEPVTVTLEKAGIDGSDVEVTIKYGTEMGCTGIIISSPKFSQMHFMGMKFFNVDNIEFSSHSSVRTGNMFVSQWRPQGEKNVKIAINYATDIKEILVPIEKRVGFLGEIPVKKGDK